MLSLVGMVLSGVVVGGGDNCGDVSAVFVISLLAMALALMPLLTRPMVVSVEEVVSIVTVAVV